MVVSESMNWELEIIWNCLEHEAKDTIREFCGLTSSEWSKTVNDMEFEIHELAVNRVL